MKRDEMYEKYQIALNASDARTLLLEHIISSANSNLDDKYLRGMLLLISEMDSWVTDYQRELKKKEID